MGALWTELVRPLGSASSASFLTALGQLAANLANYSESEKVELIAEVGGLLDSEQALNAQEKTTRFNRILTVIKLGADGYRALIERAPILSSALRAAVISALPVELRPALYRSGEAKRVKQKALGPTDIDQSLAIPTGASLDSGAVVLCLSTVDQNATRRLLEGSGIGLVRVSSSEELSRVLASDEVICACFVDSSYLRTLDIDKQTKLISDLAHYSSFMWVRLDSTALKLSIDSVYQIISSARCCDNNISGREVMVLAGAFTEVEISNVKYAARVLGANRTTRYLPGELSQDESDALIALAATRAERHDIGAALKMVSLRTKFLHDGFTTAKVVLIATDDVGLPIIAKIGTQEAIEDEAARFHQFIRSHESQLSPSTYFYKEYGIIASNLVGDVDTPFEPAPTLEDRLLKLWWSDLYGVARIPDAPTPELLVRAIRNAATRLSALNKRPLPSSLLRSMASIDLSPIHALDRATSSWGFTPQWVDTCRKAQLRFKRLDGKAIVHGDIHLRNILIRGDREAYLIDYASSGPGHPAIDLIRFEMSLYLKGCRVLASEAEYVDFQKALIRFDNTPELLIREFPRIASVQTNQVVFRGLVIARDCAIEVLQHYGGNTADYIALKYLLALQSMIIDGLQTSLARSIVDALAPTIRSD